MATLRSQNTKDLLAFLLRKPGARRSTIMRALGARVRPALGNLLHHGKVERFGERGRGRYYVVGAERGRAVA